MRNLLVILLAVGVLAGCASKDVGDTSTGIQVAEIVGKGDAGPASEILAGIALLLMGIEEAADVDFEISKKGMSYGDVADYCNDEGMKLISQGKRNHACGMFRQAAENGKPENYRTYCDYNWKPEE